VEEQPVWTTLDGDAEEVVKRSEVLHGEFPLKSGNSVTQKLRVGHSQAEATRGAAVGAARGRNPGGTTGVGRGATSGSNLEGTSGAGW
jgi:hypothetical protein